MTKLCNDDFEHGHVHAWERDMGLSSSRIGDER